MYIADNKKLEKQHNFVTNDTFTATVLLLFQNLV